MRHIRAILALLRRSAPAMLLAAAAGLAACAPQSGAARGPFPELAEYEGHQVRDVRFAGDLQLPEDSLAAAIVTRPTRCWLLVLPVCLPGTNIGRDVYELSLQELSRDVLRLQLYYRDHGYYGTRIVPSVDQVGDERVVVRFAIAPGDQVILRELEVDGVEEVLDTAEVRRRLPLAVGEPFRRIGFLSAADTIRNALLRRGHAHADVLRNYMIDTIADVAEAQFIAIPGPVVSVDSIIFLGANRISERTLRRQLTLGEGELLRRDRVDASQRAMYELPMVSFASLEIAPDSLQLDDDPTRSTLLARVVEAPQYVLDAAVGLGTVECLRTEARWLDRNFIGGGRSLELSGSLSRIGLASPLDFGLESSICSGASSTTFTPRREIQDELNYRIAADFLQPRLLNTRTELGVNLHAERLAELNAYLRESVGGQLALSRAIGQGKMLSTNLLVQRGRTLGNPALFCVSFDICTLEDLEQLEQRRWSNALSATVLWDATRTEAGRTRGFTLRGATDWASPLVFSDDRYLRVIGDGSLYRPLRPGWVLASHLRLGSFLSGGLGFDEGYIPPERRFFAGGPTSVRGFPRNGLGPRAYVVHGEEQQDTTGSSVGGTQTVVASTELRVPSPFFSEYFRLAAFVDAGQVWAKGDEFAVGDIRVTPGVGLRIITPVGPMRLDVAYNGYDPEPGPLYLIDEISNEIVLLDPAYRPRGPRSLWQRLQFSFGVGQAF